MNEPPHGPGVAAGGATIFDCRDWSHAVDTGMVRDGSTAHAMGLSAPSIPNQYSVAAISVA